VRNFWLALVLVIATPGVAAKCDAGWAEVSGSVLDASGKAAGGVAVGVTWSVRGKARGTALGVTDAAGHYSVPIEFSRYSGMSLLGGDQCEAKPEAISVVAYSGTHRSDPLSVDFVDALRMRVSDVRLQKPIRRRPPWPHQ
jgi:hypothetical protein